MAVSHPYIIGITGGIGSGKSIVSRLLQLMSVPVYDCDSEAKRLMLYSTEIRTALINAVGSEVYQENGELNRAYLAEYMFGNAERIAQINGIVHPIVRNDFKRWVKQLDRKIVAVESAILLEAKMETDVDAIWLVSAPVNIRMQRTILRDSSNEEAVRNRMKSQQDEQEYARQANKIIYNDGSRSLIQQIKELLAEIPNK
jgi:dephospho-CoA kinase